MMNSVEIEGMEQQRCKNLNTTEWISLKLDMTEIQGYTKSYWANITLVYIGPKL
jgi:hypothetical protein